MWFVSPGKTKGGDMFLRKRAILALAFLLTSSVLAMAAADLTAILLPDKKSIKVDFVRSDRAPIKAAMKASIKYRNGQASINLSLYKMEPAVLFGGGFSAYVLWAVSPDGVVENMGEVLVDEMNFNGSQKFSTGKKMFALMVTAERLAVAGRPSEILLFTSGATKTKRAKNMPFAFSDFRIGSRPEQETIAHSYYGDKTPVAIRQAQNALDIAAEMKADEVNPDAVRDAGIAFAQAKNSYDLGGSRKIVKDYARRAVELVSQAIREMNRALEAKEAADAEAKRLAQKVALEQRATDAETESQRNARELREVQAERAALARESQDLTLRAEKLAAERDELAGMLRSALSSVAETTETARGVVVNLPGILFDLNKSELKAPAQLTVAKLAGILMVFQNMNLSVEGYTDSTGAYDYNIGLSEGRAASVYYFLRSQGIPESRMKFQGFGPNSPVAPNDTSEGRAKNRRVEVVLTQAQK
jgi:outer membrane protein OmpA-like peptidoglycan-associated protein